VISSRKSTPAQTARLIALKDDETSSRKHRCFMEATDRGHWRQGRGISAAFSGNRHAFKIFYG
jgi:hypothetical protein